MYNLAQIAGIAAILLTAAFLVLYYFRPVSLLTGFCFDLLLLVLMGCGGMIITAMGNQGSFLAILLFLVIVMVAGGLLLGGVYIIIAYLLWNSVKLLRKERHSLQNMLSLFVAIGMLAQIVVEVLFGDKISANPVTLMLSGVLIILESYLAVTVFSYITTRFLNGLARPRLKSQYIIVLGSGLLDGNRVPPLLAGRIDAAIHFYEKAKKRGFQPKIILSGGQGGDETVPEAVAMRDYALEKGIPAEAMITEEQSRNTQENLHNSKKIMEEEQQGKKYRCAIATSDYHTLRARIYARKEGLKCGRTIGARTARYYAANASLREYIAIMVMNRRSNIILVGGLTALYVVFIIVSLLAEHT